MRVPIEFLILRESWGAFALPNGITFKARPTLLNLWKHPEHPDQLIFRSQTQFAVDAPEPLQGEPTSAAELREERKVLKRFPSVKNDLTPESLYQFSGQFLLQLQLSIPEVRMTNHFDSERQPILEVSHTTNIIVTAPDPANRPALEAPPPKAAPRVGKRGR